MPRDPLRIVIPGKPIAKARARYSSRNRSFYTPSRTIKAEKTIGEYGALALMGQKRFLGPLRISVEAKIPVPVSWTKLKRSMALAGETFPGKPDVDNYIKLALDALNEIVFVDDSQIVAVSGTKKYSADPATVITVEEFHA